MDLKDLKKLVVETMRETNTINYRTHPNMGVQRYYNVLWRYRKTDIYTNLLTLYDLIINDPDEALAQADDLGISPHLVKASIKAGLIAGEGIPNGQDMGAAIQKEKEEREVSAQRRRASSPDTRSMADIIYPKDSKGKIIGRAD